MCVRNSEKFVCVCVCVCVCVRKCVYVRKSVCVPVRVFSLIIYLISKVNIVFLCVSPGGLSAYALETRVEEWVKSKTGAKVEFDSSEGIHILKTFGLLSEVDSKLNVLPLEAALRCLPITPQSIVARAAEADLHEGYDRDMYLETEHEYKEEEKRTSRYGWF